MISTERLLRELGSDSAETTVEFFSAAAQDLEVLRVLSELVLRAAKNPDGLDARETNLVSWAPYVFAENGSLGFAEPLAALGQLPEGPARRFFGAYADHDLPVILLRVAGAEVGVRFGCLSGVYKGAPEVRIAGIFAAGAAWAHGLISREAALRPLRDELARMADESYADAQDDEWLDTVLDAALGLNPGDLEEELEHLREYWGLEDDWDEEFEQAAREPEAQTRERLREAFPRFSRVMQFVERWDSIDAED